MRRLFWDPTLRSPSCFHGVDDGRGGFCGFSIAPLTPDAAGYLKPMLARVEGMPLETLEAAVPWDWASFGDFLTRLGRSHRPQRGLLRWSFGDPADRDGRARRRGDGTTGRSRCNEGIA
jgi:hypothetical protein